MKMSHRYEKQSTTSVWFIDQYLPLRLHKRLLIQRKTWIYIYFPNSDEKKR